MKTVVIPLNKSKTSCLLIIWLIVAITAHLMNSPNATAQPSVAFSQVASRAGDAFGRNLASSGKVVSGSIVPGGPLQAIIGNQFDRCQASPQSGTCMNENSGSIDITSVNPVVGTMNSDLGAMLASSTTGLAPDQHPEFGASLALEDVVGSNAKELFVGDPGSNRATMSSYNPVAGSFDVGSPIREYLGEDPLITIPGLGSTIYRSKIGETLVICDRQASTKMIVLGAPGGGFLDINSEFIVSGKVIAWDIAANNPSTTPQIVNTTGESATITPSAYAKLGAALDCAKRDFDGDGYKDIVSSAYQESAGAGRVYLISGYDGHIIDSLDPPAALGQSPWFGFSIKTGDFNSDGIADLAVGAPLADYIASSSNSLAQTSASVGAVVLYFGQNTPSFFQSPILRYADQINMNSVYPNPILAQSGDLFGWDLAILKRQSQVNVDAIAVAMPGYNGNGAIATLLGPGINGNSNYPMGKMILAPNGVNLATFGQKYGLGLSEQPDWSGDGDPDLHVSSYHSASTTTCASGNPASCPAAAKGAAYLYSHNHANQAILGPSSPINTCSLDITAYTLTGLHPVPFPIPNPAPQPLWDITLRLTAPPGSLCGLLIDLFPGSSSSTIALPQPGCFVPGWVVSALNYPPIFPNFIIPANGIYDTPIQLPVPTSTLGGSIQTISFPATYWCVTPVGQVGSSVEFSIGLPSTLFGL